MDAQSENLDQVELDPNDATIGYIKKLIWHLLFFMGAYYLPISAYYMVYRYR